MNKKTATTRKKTVESQLGALRADLRSLQTDVQTGVIDVGDVAGDHASGVIQTARDIAERALHLAEDAAAGLVDDVENWSQENFDSVRSSVRTQPLGAIAVSLGIGALFGAIFLRR